MRLGESISGTVCDYLWYNIYGSVKDEVSQKMRNKKVKMVLVQRLTRDYIENLIDEIAYYDIR